MNMNMKNEKTMLALIVVAALAMVSVAGVALASDQSDAASTTWDIDNGTGNTVPAGFTQNIFIYEKDPSAWSATVVIPSDVTYSGTISIGYRDGDGTATSPFVYTAVSSITLTDASDVSILSHLGAHLLVTNTDGITIDVTKGTLYVDTPHGAPIDSAFTGTIKASGLTVEAVNTGGFNVTYGTVATFAGSVNAGVEPRTWNEGDDAYSTVTLSGVGYYKATTVGAKAALIVGDGSTISNDISSITGNVELTGFSTDVWDADKTYLSGEDGTTYAGSNTDGVIKFSSVNLGQSYTLFAFIDDSASSTHYAYYGAVAISKNSAVAGGYIATVDANSLKATNTLSATVSSTSAVITDLATSSSTALAKAAKVASPVGAELGYKSNNTFLYDKTAFDYYYAVNLSATSSVSHETLGEITFGTLTNDNKMFIVLKHISSGVFYYYLGTVAISTEITDITSLAVDSANTTSTANHGGIVAAESDKKTLNLTADDVAVLTAFRTSSTGDFGVKTTYFTSGEAEFNDNVANGSSAIVITSYTSGSSTQYYLFIGTVKVMATPTTHGVGFDCTNTNAITYDTSSMQFVSAYNFTTDYECAGTQTANGVIKFSKMNIGDNTILALFTNGTNYYFYYGTVQVTGGYVDSLLTTGTGTLSWTAVITTDAVLESGQIRSVSHPIASSEPIDIINEGTLAVNGALNLNYVNSTVNSRISNTGEINVDGTIAYQVATLAVAPLNNSTGNVNAACYKVVGTSPNPTVYYYTSLATAMTKSADITIYGTLKVLEDTTLTGTSETSNKISIPNGSTVVVGDSKDKIVAVLTLPKLTNLSLYGVISVSDGKFVTDVGVSDYSATQVVSDVLIKTTDAKTYTDIVTALDMSKDGDTLTLRQSAKFTNDAEVKDGVTLNGNAFSIIVDAGAKLTVSDGSKVTGVTDVTVNKATASKTAGQLVIDTEDFTYTGTFSMNGELVFGANYDNTASSAVAFGTIAVAEGSATAPVVITVDGAVKFGQPIAGTCVVKFTDAGKVIANADLFGTVDDKVYISGTFTATVPQTIDYVTLTGTGSIVSGNDSAIVTVSDHFVSGTPVTTLSSATNSTVAKVTLADNALAQVYGTYDSTKIVFTAAAGNLYTTAYYLTEEIVYATFTECNDTATVHIADIAEPVITSYVFQNWYTSVNYNKVVEASDALGDYSKVYGLFTIKTVSVTVNPLVNGHWVINGNVITSGSDVPLKESDNSIEFVADSTYKIDGDTTILVNGSAMPLGYQPTAGDELSVTANIVKDESVGGMDLVTMLLIVITIVIVIMAIIIALKLMRS